MSVQKTHDAKMQQCSNQTKFAQSSGMEPELLPAHGRSDNELKDAKMESDVRCSFSPSYKAHLQTMMDGLSSMDEDRQRSFDIAEAMRLLGERTVSHPVATVAAVRQLFVKYLNEIWITEDPPKGEFDTTALVEDLFAERRITFRLSWRARNDIRNLFDAAVSLFGRDFRTFPVDKLLTVEHILDLHRRVCAHMRNAGQLRNVVVRPNGVSETLYFPPQYVSSRLDALVAFIREQQVLVSVFHSDLSPQARAMKTWHAIRIGTVFFSEFLRIHPFEDGNGRTARLLFSFLIHEWVPVPVSLVVSKDKKPEYLAALEQRSDLQPPRALARLTMNCCLRSAAEVYELLNDEGLLTFERDVPVAQSGFKCWC